VLLEVLKKYSDVITAPEYCLHINLEQYLRKDAMQVSNFLQKKIRTRVQQQLA
jgi:hypothetical protein